MARASAFGSPPPWALAEMTGAVKDNRDGSCSVTYAVPKRDNPHPDQHAHGHHLLFVASAASQKEATPAVPVREDSGMEREAWRLLQRAVDSYCIEPMGTVAAEDPEYTETLNCNQVFISDFVLSALSFLLHGEIEIVCNLLLHTLQLQLPGQCRHMLDSCQF